MKEWAAFLYPSPNTGCLPFLFKKTGVLLASGRPDNIAAFNLITPRPFSFIMNGLYKVNAINVLINNKVFVWVS